jgi:hypothetical protein
MLGSRPLRVLYRDAELVRLVAVRPPPAFDRRTRIHRDRAKADR